MEPTRHAGRIIKVKKAYAIPAYLFVKVRMPSICVQSALRLFYAHYPEAAPSNTGLFAEILRGPATTSGATVITPAGTPQDFMVATNLPYGTRDGSPTGDTIAEA